MGLLWLGAFGVFGAAGAWGQGRFGLEDLVAADQPARREAAARYLVAVPESPALALRNFARRGGWRRRVALLRVLGERGELRPEEVLSGLGDEVWVVRLQALRAAALMDGALRDAAVLGRIRALLRDEFVAVGREAARALGALGVLGDPQLVWLCGRRGFGELGRRLFLAWPERFGARGFRGCLRAKEGRAEFLLRLPGRIGAGHRRLLYEEQKAWARAGERCLAYRCLGDARLREPGLVALVKRALREPGGREAGTLLGHVLPAEAKGRFLQGLEREEDEGVFEACLQMGEGAPAEAKAGLRDRLLAFEPERRERVLAFLVGAGVPGLLEMGLRALADPGADAGLRRLWLRGLGGALIRDARGRKLLAALLGTGGAERELAFHLFCIEGIFDPALPKTALALSGGRRSAPLLALLRFRDKVPLPFWLTLLQAPHPKIRWVAYQGIRGRDWPRALGARLLRLFSTEVDRSAQKALLTTLLSLRGDGELLRRVVAAVLAARKAYLDHKLLELLEESHRPWAAGLLRSLLASRLGPKAWVSLAVRGEPEALRRILVDPGAYGAGELRRVRKGMIGILREEDLPLLAPLLLGDTPDFAKLEIVLWLRGRKDLPARPLLESLLPKAEEPELREQVAGALVERGRWDLLGRTVEDWIRKKGEEDEGMILEMLDALPQPIPAKALPALARILAAPAARDPLRAVLLERRGSFFQGRVRASMPLVLPTLRAMRSADPEAFRAALIRNLRDPKKSPAWFCVTKDYLAHILLLAQEWEGTARACEPLFAWAERLGPRPAPIDGVLSLLRAGAELRAGRVVEASRSFDQGLASLHLVAPDERSLQDLASLLTGVGQDSGVLALHFRERLLQALRFRGDPERLGEILVSARIAARGDPRSQARLRRLERRLGRLLPENGDNKKKER
ncbi:MAG TPA: hypothetical protein ENK02_11355 [Planctomycetes bacterium]|nr:hypothetical protein [Planctomycetota bacterium]